MDIRAKIQNGEYDNLLPRTLYKGPTEERIIAQDAYRAESRRLKEQFYKDCCETFGLDHEAPKNRMVFDSAWSHGHANGEHEVLVWFEELINLIRSYVS